MGRAIITVAREFGSGGRTIAAMIAEKLGVPFYDRRIIAMAASETGLSEEFIEKQGETRTNSLLYSLYDASQVLPMEDQVFIAQSKVIRRVAEEGPCVIVGRCGGYVLRERTDCLHVFIHAPYESRVRRAVEEYNIPADDAQAQVLRFDRDRASYHHHFTDRKWGDYTAYDLCVNSDLGLPAVADMIVSLVK